LVVTFALLVTTCNPLVTTSTLPVTTSGVNTHKIAQGEKYGSLY
jgi:hypothetical protein